MLDRLLPRQFDNQYRGLWPGLWLLAPLVLVRLLQGVNCLLDPRSIAVSADAIPLDRFAPAASAQIVVLFALSALGFLLFALQGLLALIRYRSMVPLMYVWFLVDALIRRVVIAHYPTQDAVAPGGHAIGFYVNMGLLAVAVLGLALSLVARTPRRAAA